MNYVYLILTFAETKSQFARDDPAFLVLFATWLCRMFFHNSNVFNILIKRLCFSYFHRFCNSS